MRVGKKRATKLLYAKYVMLDLVFADHYLVWLPRFAYKVIILHLVDLLFKQFHNRLF